MDKEKEILSFLDACVRHSRFMSYDPLLRKKRDTVFANDYALVSCFFDTLETALRWQMEEKENNTKK